MRMEISIELGENKGDKYGDRWETRRIRAPKAPRMNNSNEERKWRKNWEWLEEQVRNEERDEQKSFPLRPNAGLMPETWKEAR